MQKVIRRSKQALRHADRQKEKFNKRVELFAARQRRQEEIRVFKERASVIKQSRVALREDWALGPLAPKRDVGKDPESYGTMSRAALQAAKIRPSEREEMWWLKAGDRVVVIRGKDTGKIGEIRELDEERGAIWSNDFNNVDIYLEPEERDQRQQTQAISAQPMYVRWKDVKLVWPLEDPKTGEIKDVVIDEVEKRESIDPYTGETQLSRWIPGTETEISWPAYEPRHYEDYESDTQRIDVDKETYERQLGPSPFPLSVLHELKTGTRDTALRYKFNEAQIRSLEEEDHRTSRIKAIALATPEQEYRALIQASNAQRRALEPSSVDERGVRDQKIVNTVKKRLVETMPQDALSVLLQTAQKNQGQAALFREKLKAGKGKAKKEKEKDLLVKAYQKKQKAKVTGALTWEGLMKSQTGRMEKMSV